MLIVVPLAYACTIGQVRTFKSSPSVCSIMSKFNTCKCTNLLQLIDCKCEVDPIGNCAFEKQLCLNQFNPNLVPKVDRLSLRM
jgi:hypothetical protein